ncbi:hypothetical protein Hanom_Chr03g00277971 [Helianthus anomalus]
MMKVFRHRLPAGHSAQENKGNKENGGGTLFLWFFLFPRLGFRRRYMESVVSSEGLVVSSMARAMTSGGLTWWWWLVLKMRSLRILIVCHWKVRDRSTSFKLHIITNVYNNSINKSHLWDLM